MVRLIVNLIHDDLNNTSRGHVATILGTCARYGLLKNVVRSVLSGEYVNISLWKHNVTKLVNTTDFQSWKIRCCMYKCLEMNNFMKCQMHTISPWWIYMSPTILRTLRGVALLSD